MESIQGSLLMLHLVQMYSFPQIFHPRQQMLDARTATDFILSVTRHQCTPSPPPLPQQRIITVPEKWENNPALLTPQITNSSRHRAGSTPRLPTSSTAAPKQKRSPRERLHALLEGGCGNRPALPLSWQCRRLADRAGRTVPEALLSPSSSPLPPPELSVVHQGEMTLS